MSQVWFANNGQILQLAAATISAIIGITGIISGIKQKKVLWIRLSAFALLILLSFFLYYIYSDPIEPRWLWGIFLILLSITVGVAGGFAFFSFFKWKAGSPASGAGEQAHGTIEVLDVKLQRSDQNPKVIYKRKLRIVLQNKSSRHILVGPRTNWLPDKMRTRAIEQQVWELEGKDGWHSGSWSGEERAELQVPPGKAFRTWIGLHPNADEAEVAQLYAQKQLGTLVVPFRVISAPEERQIVV